MLGMKVTDRNTLYMISDQHCRILAAINDDHIGWGPGMAHRCFCIYLLANNFKNQNIESVTHERSIRVSAAQVPSTYGENAEAKFRRGGVATG